ncbi:hypothetical protein M9H77_23396 [Catharanthus roseus]|uniref:Uncharacterized protein n=1 Tax=Catharanthus roseus TaxID=4058 RepID=A0ACC0AXA7_CATRO|nr:hypothetical protein M9H77_23396 [Catharanthus roseus]
MALVYEKNEAKVIQGFLTNEVNRRTNENGLKRSKNDRKRHKNGVGSSLPLTASHPTMRGRPLPTREVADRRLPHTVGSPLPVAHHELELSHGCLELKKEEQLRAFNLGINRGIELEIVNTLLVEAMEILGKWTLPVLDQFHHRHP